MEVYLISNGTNLDVSAYLKLKNLNDTKFCPVVI